MRYHSPDMTPSYCNITCSVCLYREDCSLVNAKACSIRRANRERRGQRRAGEGSRQEPAVESSGYLVEH